MNTGVLQRLKYCINGDEFSEPGAFATRMSDEGFGFLKHAGENVAFALTTGFGDGVYPVYVGRSGSGHVTAVRIVFIPQGDIDAIHQDYIDHV